MVDDTYLYSGVFQENAWIFARLADALEFIAGDDNVEGDFLVVG